MFRATVKNMKGMQDSLLGNVEGPSQPGASEQDVSKKKIDNRRRTVDQVPKDFKIVHLEEEDHANQESNKDAEYQILG